MTPATSAPPPLRRSVVTFAAALAIITYIDRVCIAQAAPLIMQDLALTKVQMGYVFSAFTLAYAFFEIPTGWLADRQGARGVMLRIVLFWSCFTAATGAAWNFLSLLVCRFLFGVGEAGCFPVIAKIFSVWLPPAERVRAQGQLWLAARWGGALTPLLMLGVLSLVSWRVAFFAFGLLGVVWSLLFVRWYRDRPADHPAITPEELALLPRADATTAEPAPWRAFLRHPTTWLLWIQYFCMGYAWFFFITWLPTYLKEARGVSLQNNALLSGLPLLLGGLGALASARLTPLLTRRLGAQGPALRLLGGGGYLLAGLLLIASTQIDHAPLAIFVMSLAGFANDLALPATWSVATLVAGRHVGAFSGGLGMLGSLGGVASPIASAYLLRASGGSWNLTFTAAAAAYLIGAICWWRLDTAPITDR